MSQTSFLWSLNYHLYVYIFLASVSREPPSVIEEHPHRVRSAHASNHSQGLCFYYWILLTIFIIIWFKSTNQRIATISSSKPQPCPAQGCLFGRNTLIGGFEPKCIPQMPLLRFLDRWCWESWPCNFRIAFLEKFSKDWALIQMEHRYISNG